MHLKLSCYQLKTDCYKTCYQSLIVITVQTPRIGTDDKEKKAKHTTTKITSLEIKIAREEESNKGTRK